MKSNMDEKDATSQGVRQDYLTQIWSQFITKQLGEQMSRHSNNSKVKGIPVSKLKHFNRHVSQAKCSTQGKQIFHPPKLLLAVSRLPFLELYFAAVLSLVFCIFRTFLTIFCSSTKKARIILHRVVAHKITRWQILGFHNTICPPLFTHLSLTAIPESTPP